MKNWKTTTIGVLTIIGAVANAATSYLKTGTLDFAGTMLTVGAGWGLILAKDAGVTGTVK